MMIGKTKRCVFLRVKVTEDVRISCVYAIQP